jgi:hypothetical protein
MSELKQLRLEDMIELLASKDINGKARKLAWNMTNFLEYLWNQRLPTKYLIIKMDIEDIEFLKRGTYGQIIYKGEVKVVKPSKMYEFKYGSSCKSCLETLYNSEYNSIDNNYSFFVNKIEGIKIYLPEIESIVRIVERSMIRLYSAISYFRLYPSEKYSKVFAYLEIKTFNYGKIRGEIKKTKFSRSYIRDEYKKIVGYKISTPENEINKYNRNNEDELYYPKKYKFEFAVCKDISYIKLCNFSRFF